MTTPLVPMVAALVGMAAELQAVGAIRFDHDTKWQRLRISLDQLAAEAQAIDDTPPPAAAPEAQAFDALKAELKADLQAVHDRVALALAEVSTVRTDLAPVASQVQALAHAAGV